MKPFAITCTLMAVCSAETNVGRMDEIVQHYVNSKQFMGTVLIAKGRDIILNKGYGYSNLEWNIRNDPITKFRLGSVTKQFTATCILLLEEQGRLSVNDLIKKHLPDAPDAWNRITIFHLLTHTSGLPNFTSFPEYRSQKPFASTAEQTVAGFRNKALMFQPGKKWDYSNSGYLLLGHLIEKITGAPYKVFVQENIFKPLGMKDSGYDLNTEIIQHRASGYTPGSNGPENAGFIHMTIPHAAGALYSTTEDLLRWQQGVFGGKLLSAASVRKMTTPFLDDYALGVSVHKTKSHTVISHSGGIEGFNTRLIYDLDDKLTVVVLANLNGPAADIIAETFLAVAHGDTVKLPTERRYISVAPQVLAQYSGAYQLAPSLAVIITTEGNQLMAQTEGQAKSALSAESETNFYWNGVGAEIEFLKDEHGTVTLVFRQGGIERKALRK